MLAPMDAEDRKIMGMMTRIEILMAKNKVTDGNLPVDIIYDGLSYGHQSELGKDPESAKKALPERLHKLLSIPNEDLPPILIESFDNLRGRLTKFLAKPHGNPA